MEKNIRGVYFYVYQLYRRVVGGGDASGSVSAFHWSMSYYCIVIGDYPKLLLCEREQQLENLGHMTTQFDA